MLAAIAVVMLAVTASQHSDGRAALAAGGAAYQVQVGRVDF